MCKWILTPQELLYCAAQTGAQRFYGVDDPFYPMEPEQIRAVIPQLQQSLEKKGVARLGFDDSFQLQGQAAELIGVCAGCQRYLLLRCTRPGQQDRNIRVYYRDGKAVLAADAQDGICLEEVPAQDLAELLLGQLPNSGQGGETGQAVSLSYGLLSQAQKTAAEDAAAARALLIGQGAEEGLAGRLIRCLGFGTPRAVLCRGDLQRRSLDTAVLLFDEQGCICMTAADVEEQLWLVRSVSPEDMGAVMAEWIGEVTRG